MGDFEKSILRAYLYLKNSSKRSMPKKTVAQVQRAEKRHACDTGGGGRGEGGILCIHTSGGKPFLVHERVFENNVVPLSDHPHHLPLFSSTPLKTLNNNCTISQIILAF